MTDSGPEQKYVSYYSDLFYNCLPTIYQNRDKESGGPLKKFFQVIAESAALMRSNTEQLWSNFFIDTCDSWAIPYIGDIVGTNLVLNVAARNRTDVKKTIHWRKRKGNLLMLEELANFITGWNARAVEFFENLVWNQNMNAPKFNHIYTPDLRNSIALDRIYRAGDTTCHNIDVRNPNQSSGWYNIKNIGFFFSRMEAFKIKNGQPLDGNSLTPSKPFFYFNSTGNDTQLYDQNTMREIRKSNFSKNPYSYFGEDNGMSIKIYNILAANQEKGSVENIDRAASEETSLLQFGSLKDTGNIWLLEPRKFSNPRKFFKITAYFWKNNSSTTELGVFYTRNQQFTPSTNSMSVQEEGCTLISIERADGSEPCVFPETVLGIKVDNSSDAINSINSNLKNSLYVYLPQIYLDKKKVFFMIDTYGSTYFTNNLPRTGTPDPSFYNIMKLDNAAGKLEIIARKSLGQIHPPRELTDSTMEATGFLKLNQEHGIRLVDKSRLSDSFEISAYAIYKRNRYLLGKLSISPTNTIFTMGQPTASERSLYEDEQNSGKFVLLIKPIGSSKDPKFPMSEIVITNKSNQSILVYLPEISSSGNFWETETTNKIVWNDNGSDDKVKYFFPADDGSTYSYSPQGVRDIWSDKSIRFEPNKLVRRSAGQIMPMLGKMPIRFRVPIIYGLGDESGRNLINDGELAINTVMGFFCFSNQDRPASDSLTVDFNYGFPARLGAGPYDKTVLDYEDTASLDYADKITLDYFENVKRKNLTKPTRWVTKSKDVSDEEACILAGSGKKVIFDNLNALFDEISESKNALEEEIIQIDDSSLYELTKPVDFSSRVVKNLVLRTTNGTRPVIKSQQPIKIGKLESIVLSGLLIDSNSSVNIVADKLFVTSSSINPGKIALNLDVSEAVVINRSIIGKITVTSDAVMKIYNSIIDGDLGIQNSLKDIDAVIDRSTIMGKTYVTTLVASETIFDDVATVKKRQEGCIRYSRYQEKSILPRTYQCTTMKPIYNSRNPANPNYLQLNVKCDEQILKGAENNSEMGVYYYGYYSLAYDNFKIKLKEYLPITLKPAVILEA